MFPVYLERIAAEYNRPVPQISMSTFSRARWDPAFKDVKRRVKHRHCQCPTCMKLAEQAKRGFDTEYARSKYLERRNLHKCSVEAFRRLEIDFQQRAAHSPQDNLVLFYDDTSYSTRNSH